MTTVSVTYSLRLRFRDTNDALVSFTITPAQVPADTDDITELMNLILSTNAFYTYTEGDIHKKVDALLVATEEEEVEIDHEQ